MTNMSSLIIKQLALLLLLCNQQPSPISESHIQQQEAASKMVCVMCLIPLFLVPIVNLLPLLFDYLMGKFYGVMGWEYRKPERAPPACPYKPPAAAKNDSKVTEKHEPAPADSVAESAAAPRAVELKQD